MNNTPIATIFNPKKIHREFLMVAGIILIVVGILVALFPPILSIIVATFLFLLGMAVLVSAYDYKRMSRRSNNHVIDLMFRF